MNTEELREIGLNVDHRHEAIKRFCPELSVVVEAWPYRIEPIRPDDEVYTVEFVVRTLFDTTDLNGVKAFAYQKKGSPSSPDPVLDIEDGEWEFAGGVKWDGCVNYYYPPGPLHGCGIHSRETELAVWKVVYEMASELMPGTCDWR